MGVRLVVIPRGGLQLRDRHDHSNFFYLIGRFDYITVCIHPSLSAPAKCQHIWILNKIGICHSGICHFSTFPLIPACPLTPSLTVHLQTGLELVKLEDIDHKQEQHDEVDKKDGAYNLRKEG
jgi:hypothetical protein